MAKATQNAGTPAETTTVKNAQLKVARVKKNGDEDFGIKETNVNYLLIITDKGQIRLNIGDKTLDTIKELIS